MDEETKLVIACLCAFVVGFACGHTEATKEQQSGQLEKRVQKLEQKDGDK